MSRAYDDKNEETSSRQSESIDMESDEDENEEEDNIRYDALLKIVNLAKQEETHGLGKEDINVIRMYYELFFPFVVGKLRWKMNHQHVSVRILVTVADEALVRLILENNVEEWVEIARGKTIDKNKRLTRYTHGGTGGKGTKKGWSMKGKKRYNTLHKEIKRFRQTEEQKTIDDELKDI